MSQKYNPVSDHNPDADSAAVPMQQVPAQAAPVGEASGVRLQTVAVPIQQGNAYPALQSEQQSQQGVRADQVFVHVAPQHPQAFPAQYPNLGVAPGQPQLTGNELVAVQPPAPTPAQLDEILQARVTRFGCCKYLKEGHNLLKHNCCVSSGFVMMVIVLQVAVSILVFVVGRALAVPVPDEEEDWYDYYYDYDSYSYPVESRERPPEPQNNFVQDLVTALVQVVFTVLVFYPLTAGFYYAIFTSMRQNAHVRFSDFFNGFKGQTYCRLLPLSLTLAAVGAIGNALFVIPGILWGLFTVFAIPLHLEHPHLTTWGAISRSAKTVCRQCCNTFWFLVLLGIVAISGVLLLVVGLFYTIPLATIAFCYLYHHLVGVNGVTVYVPVSAASLQPNSPRHVMLDAI